MPPTKRSNKKSALKIPSLQQNSTPSASSLQRKIPATMATQHPDNASAPYFLPNAFIDAKEEIEECYRCYNDLQVQEFMWDWEGKFVDEAVIDRLFNQYNRYFHKNQLGKDIFLTFRIPNIWIESSHKLPRAMMNILSAEKAAKTYKFHSPPLFEIILPMTTSDTQLIYLQKTFGRIAKAYEEIFESKTDFKTLNVIPLFEEFEVMSDVKTILYGYTDFLKKEYKFIPPYLRLFTARSDTAMNGGFLPAKLAVKLAINQYHEFAEETGIQVYPWVGGGCLPFRGGINPENIDAAIEEYRGVSTLTVQSAFRYDYPLDQVKKAIKKLNAQIPKNASNPLRLNISESKAITALNRTSANLYKPFIEKIAPTINILASKLPSHRERVQHIGLFGYSRGIGKVTLPRAIKFTGALYSLGIPPELIATGRSLQIAKETGILPLILKCCPNLHNDMIHAGHYFNHENLELLSKNNRIFLDILKDIELIESILNIKIGPQKPHHFIHRNLASNIFFKLQTGEDFSSDTLSAAKIRKSLG